MQSIDRFDKLKWAFQPQQLNSDSKEMGHLNIPKLHALTHYVDWIKEKGTLDNVNTAVTETMHKILKDAFRNSN
jgi:hypothetical protein